MKYILKPVFKPMRTLSDNCNPISQKIINLIKTDEIFKSLLKNKKFVSYNNTVDSDYGMSEDGQKGFAQDAAYEVFVKSIDFRNCNVFNPEDWKPYFKTIEVIHKKMFTHEIGAIAGKVDDKDFVLIFELSDLYFDNENEFPYCHKISTEGIDKTNIDFDKYIQYLKEVDGEEVFWVMLCSLYM